MSESVHLAMQRVLGVEYDSQVALHSGIARSNREDWFHHEALMFEVAAQKQRHRSIRFGTDAATQDTRS